MFCVYVKLTLSELACKLGCCCCCCCTARDDDVLFLVLLSQERKNIYYIPQTQYRAAWLWAAWPKFLQFRVGAPVAVVLFVNPAPPPAYGAVPSLPPPLPPADLPSADLPRAPWCLPNLSASRQVGQVIGAVEFWL